MAGNEYKLKVVGQFEDDMSKGLNTANQSLGNLGDGLDALKGKASGFGDFLKANLVSSAITASLSAIRDGIKATTDALVDMGKTAYAEGAKLEQSLGGVDTMFKDAASQVKANAADAWISGIGANEYMEQVTSFSAALIQSLSGDTATAAQVADMAIMDMADNANKFGTDISSIQNAYQGFAKQNYTMLDNLKLGYGGTKEEMERMLADAEKLTGIHYDISNLADVFNAIHAIQTELGVAGVSAEEARTTMEGSAKKLKASWKNMLGSITLGDDITDELSAVKESVNDWTNNLVPAVESILDALPQVADGIVDIADDMMAKFGTELVSRAGPLAEAGGKIIGTVLSGLARSLPQILSMGGQIVSQIGEALQENAPAILDSIGNMLSGVPARLAEHAGVLLEWGQIAYGKLQDWLSSLSWNDIVDFVSNGVDGAGALLGKVQDWLGNIDFRDIAHELHLDAIFTTENTAQMVESFGNFFKELVDTGGELATTFASVGLDILKAIVRGISDNKDVIGSTLSDSIESLTTTIGNWVADNIDDILSIAADSIILFFFDLAPQAIYGFVRGLGNVDWGVLLTNIKDGILDSLEKGYNKVIGLGAKLTADVFGMDEETKKYLDDYGWDRIGKDWLTSGALEIGARITGVEIDDEALRQSTLYTRKEFAELFYELWGNDTDLASNLIGKAGDQGVMWTDDFVNTVKERIQVAADEIKNGGQELSHEAALYVVQEIYDTTLAEFQAKNPYQEIIDNVENLGWNELGQDIVEGISDGVEQNGSLLDKLQVMAQNAFDAVKTFFGIESPSKLMRDEIGKFIPEGIAVGIDENTDSLFDAMSTVRNVVLDGAERVIGSTSASAYGANNNNNNTLSVGGIVNNIYGQAGQSESELADSIVDIIIARLGQEGAVFA